MKRKYIEEKYDIYYDGAGSLFYRFNTRDEKELDVSCLPKETAQEIVKEHNRLLEEIIRLTNELEPKE